MCGRFTLLAPKAMLEELFSLQVMGDLPPRFNIAPSQPVAAVRPAKGGGNELTLFQWGLIPSWSKDPAIGARMINARSETAAEKPSFRAAMKRRRCLIPASGFYEWGKAGAAKQPYFIHMKDRRPFAMAGLWEQWGGEDGSELETCAILTTSPNELVGEIHQRMPVIIAPEDYGAWMDPTCEKPADIAHLLRPFPADEMAAYPVDRRVNSPRNDDPACIEPLEDLPDESPSKSPGQSGPPESSETLGPSEPPGPSEESGQIPLF
jgi:putative SOS response-associated peptidase YedK